ncbi:MAG: 30S ribosomal protein S6 [Candidatus Moranbacteria bacterium]|nr:30S ribosomal protein S6 [Candidatus Moranbacteria bacterium]
MIEYELLYLVGLSKKSEMETIAKDVTKIVTEASGTFKKSKIIFERKLAYEIKHESRGTYIAQRFTLPTRDEKDFSEKESHPLDTINKQLNLYQDVLRFVLVRAEELPSLEEFEKKINQKNRSSKPDQKEKGTARKDASSQENIDKKIEEVLHI